MVVLSRPSCLRLISLFASAGPQTVSAMLPLPLSLSLITARLESSYYRQSAAVQSDLAWMQVRCAAPAQEQCVPASWPRIVI